MALTRAQLAQYLGRELARFQAQVPGKVSEDTEAGYRDQIDDALMFLGVPHSALTAYIVPDSLVPKAKVSAVWHALLWYAKTFGANPGANFAGPALTSIYSNLLKQVESLLDRVASQGKALNLILVRPEDSPPPAKRHKLRLNIFEPR